MSFSIASVATAASAAVSVVSQRVVTEGESDPAVPPAAAEAVNATVDVLQLILAAAIGFGVGVFLMFVVQGIIRYLLRSQRLVREVLRPTARPLQLALGAAGAWVGLSLVLREDRPSWYSNAVHVVIIVEIIALTWFIAAAVRGIEHAVLETMQEAGESRYRKMQTQMQILQRVITVVIWLCGFAGILLTFPVARTLGTSLLASAGIVSVIAGIAAQSTFGNVFAGLQLAFSDSIRVGDVLTWEGHRCNVEEITLTYVVLRVWDGRRLIVPSSKMTTQTFANWTRRSSDILDHVDFRLDWSAPIAEIRAYLGTLLEATDLWDGRVGVLQVRDTDGETIQISALVSAKNSSTLIDLRNYLREEMVTWLQREYPEALPHTRYFNYNWEEADRPGGRERLSGTLGVLDEPSEPTEMHDASKGYSSAAQVAPAEASTPAAPRRVVENNEADEDGHIPARPHTGDGEQDRPLPAEDHQRDLEETTVMTLGDLGMDPNQPERTPIGQRPSGGDEVATSSPRTAGHASSVFSGSLEAEEREREFESAGAAAAAEREEAARRKSEREGTNTRGEDIEQVRDAGDSAPEQDDSDD